MGLDTVEIILETERRFAIDLPDAECARVSTVGDLYGLVLRKLKLPYLPAVEVESHGCVRHGSFLSTWEAPDVWCTLRAVIVEQLQVEADEVKEDTRFLEDLGSD